MTQKTITIEIDEQGHSSLDLSGFQGKGCADVATAFQASDAIVRQNVKREYYVEARLQQQHSRQ